MTGNIETQRFFFEGQRLLGSPFSYLRINVARFARSLGGRAEHGEDIDLMARLVALMRLPGFHRVVQRADHACPRDLRGIESTAFDQALDHAAIDRRHIDAPAKVEKRTEGTVL